MEYWNSEMIFFLKDNYKTMGDMDIVRYFKKHFKKEKTWTRSHISKKRQQLGLKRKNDEVNLIIKNNIKNKRYNTSKKSWNMRHELKTYDRKTQFAKNMNFSGIPDAISKLGKYEFNLKFNQYDNNRRRNKRIAT